MECSRLLNAGIDPRYVIFRDGSPRPEQDAIQAAEDSHESFDEALPSHLRNTRHHWNLEPLDY